MKTSASYNRLIPLIGLLIAGCGDSNIDTSSCETGQSMCPDGICYDLQNDDKHCGRCDVVCNANETCQSGVCEPIPIESRCDSPKRICDEQCVDPRNDRNFCGDCNTKCLEEQVCDGGNCVWHCESPKSECSDGCFNLNNDSKNCKTCGHDCNAGLSASDPQYVCVAGECVRDCPEGELVCGGNCTDPKTDEQYCGAKDDCEGENAGTKCVAGAECNRGECACSTSGQVVCKIGDALQCADPNADATCGCDADGAGLVCSELSNITDGACNGGQCEITCRPGFNNCNQDVSDGCEADLNSAETCGSCDNACDTNHTTSAVCESGECILTCTEDTVMCKGADGKDHCMDLSEDNDNCGWCGNKCEGKSECHGGFCVIDASECKDGYVDDIPVVDYNGNATKIRAYCINDLEELKKLRDHINTPANSVNNIPIPYPSAADNPNNAYILMSNINMGEKNEWEPIGKGPTFKDAYFLGNGKKIYGSLVNSGLFAIATNSVLDGLNLELDIYHDPDKKIYNNPGALVEIVDNNVALRHIREKGNIQCYSTPCGGIAGIVSGKCTNTLSMIEMKGSMDVELKNSSNIGGIAGVAVVKSIEHAHADLTINDKTGYPLVHGLLVGYLYDNPNCSENTEYSLISDCHVKGNLIVPDDTTFSSETNHSAVMGGLLGQVSFQYNDLKIENSSADAQIKMQAHNSGGLIAQLTKNHDIKVEIMNSSAKGDIECWSNCGGLIGILESSAPTSEEDVEHEKFVVQNSHAEVNVLGSGQLENMDNIGGFVGKTSHSIFENCTSKGQIETWVSKYVGGFIGSVSYSELKNNSFEGEVSGNRSVGGLIGEFVISQMNGGVAKGKVRGYDTNIGGLIGSATALSRVENGMANVEVQGKTSAGSLIGLVYNSELLNSVALGNVVCTNGNCGMIGSVWGSSTVRQIANYGEVEGLDAIGGLVGLVNEGPHDFDNIFLTGTVTAEQTPGAVFGVVGRATVNPPVNVYYWANPLDIKIIGNSDIVVDEKNIKPFTYDDSHIPVLEDGTKLMDKLTASGKWIEVACELKSGPGLENPGVYMLPVLKGLGLDICE